MATKFGFTITSPRLFHGPFRKKPIFSSSSASLGDASFCSSPKLKLINFAGKKLAIKHRVLVLSPKATTDQPAVALVSDPPKIYYFWRIQHEPIDIFGESEQHSLYQDLLTTPLLVSGQLNEDEVEDSKILQYCSIDGKGKKSLGEMEQEFLQALQSFYYEGKAMMSNEEFDNLKEELMWEGSSVVMLSTDEQKFLEASMAYVSGNPIMTDKEYDKLKMKLKRDGSDIVVEGPRCSLRSRKVYSDLSVDYLKMFLLNVPAAVVALGLFFFLDDLTGFEITYLLELPEPFSFIFTWFAALPLILYLSFTFTNIVVKDFLILKGPCPNCGTENTSFFGTILSVSSGGSTNKIKCSGCGMDLVYDSDTRLITLPEGSSA